jgi:multicomponent Na+:H+ antiporter subunit D
MLAVVYVWRFVEAADLHDPSEQRVGVSEAPWSMLLPSAVLVAATVYFGLDTSLTLGSAYQAAQDLMGGPR